MVNRRDLLSSISTVSILGSAWGLTTGRVGASSTIGINASHESTGGKRDDRVQLVEADPEFGFNFSYWLATPESYRDGPVPLLFEMNNADEEHSYEEVKFDRAKAQITETSRQGAWLSEELGVPHLKPIVPRPNGDPIDATHWTILLDRETMLLESTKYERLDRQLLRMADHARQEVLTDLTTHEKLLFYGSSSEGVVAERMAAMHPEQIIAATGSGLNGFVLLPFKELGGHTLNYPVGVADYENILGKVYDRDAHDGVDMFYIQGGQDPKNRLKMENGFGGHLWNDRQVYDAARAVYGADIVEERFPRCHIAFEKAGIDAQFRVYPDMTHNPNPASHDLLNFYEKSIAGEDVSEFGQRLELPLDREPVIVSQEQTAEAINVEFEVSGSWPPPEGLVTYSWTFGDGETDSGLRATHTFGSTGEYNVTLSMETAHGQRGENTATVTIYDVTNIQWSSKEILPGESASVTATVENPLQESKTVKLVLARGPEQGRFIAHSKEVTFEPGESRSVDIGGVLGKPGEYALVVGDMALKNRITVLGDPNKRVSFVSEVPDEPIRPGTTVPITVHVVFTDNVKAGSKFGFPLRINGETVDGRDVEVQPYSSATVTFEQTFQEPGEYQLSTRCCGDLYPSPIDLGIIVVKEPTPSPKPTAAPSPTATETETTTTSMPNDSQTETPGQPGFGVISTLAGFGSAVGYLLSRNDSDD